ncbi:bifunctional 2-polyprenyl-6-hydroxyphenol methylase/3-demethylubiquinol 3-O-methyltransferase UbiG [Polynucleobacter sp. AM-25C3]|uniref:class I SAM-dependent methyltransferase n=1 Tax=Polynucleobacter sp. AM-25C3 TaxID=1855569 RepID=UPI001C0CC980|nr:class I SAM-dependent methyltransferase [Polynucleobacter sp. AM-25C3]MBU3602149.1 class I SAM-dependent methyltransferase [Polynucleobacter sp. AM-25C3]
MQNKSLNYDPSIFDHASIEGAKEIVLTTESGISTQTRWDTETPWLLNLIGKHIIKPSGLVVDYGCGVGRLAGPLVDQGYSVIGVDASSSMRQHATNLIASERFMAMTPATLEQLVGIGIKADFVLAIWVLQHCFDLDAEVGRIYKTLNKGGIVGVADMRHRAVPTNQGWCDDGRDVKETLSRFFMPIQQYPYNPPSAPKGLQGSAYVAFFQKNR